MTTCPSGVNYMHLVDHARAHIEKTYRRPLLNRLTRTHAGSRAALSQSLPCSAETGQPGPALFGAALTGIPVPETAGSDAGAGAENPCQRARATFHAWHPPRRRARGVAASRS